jgi:hypothetical protein
LQRDNTWHSLEQMDENQLACSSSLITPTKMLSCNV